VPTPDLGFDVVREEDGWAGQALRQVCGRRQEVAHDQVEPAVGEPEDEQWDLGADLLDTLGSLVDESLVRQEEGAGGEPRFLMLETVHEYARERLEESGELEELRRRHAHFFLQLAEKANVELRRAQQALWFQRLEEEHGNMRAALAWCQGPGGEIETGLRIAAALGQTLDGLVV
jgi:predicted ATPase